MRASFDKYANESIHFVGPGHRISQFSDYWISKATLVLAPKLNLLEIQTFRKPDLHYLHFCAWNGSCVYQQYDSNKDLQRNNLSFKLQKEGGYHVNH